MKKLSLLPSVAFVLIALPAAAGDPKADAARLFEQGRTLLAEGKTGEACAKYAESMRLAPNGGTLLNLADCYEKNGQTASAYVRYREAAERARAAGQKKAEAGAEARMKALEATLARLTIRLAADSAPGTKVTLDGEAVKTDDPIPVDPGGHAIVATADGREPATRTVQVPKTAAVLDIEMPVLRPLTGAAPTPVTPTEATETKPPPPETPPAKSEGGITTMRWAGIGTAVLGAAAIGVGVAFGLSAKSKNDEAAEGCTNGDPNRCSSESVALTGDAKGAAAVSTVFFVTGAAALAGGVVLIILGGKSNATATALLRDGFAYRF